MITIKAGVLKNALQLLQGVVQTKTVHEYLQCVLIKNENNVLTLQATNLDASITSKITDFTGNIEGFCINHNTFFEIVKKYNTEDEIKINIEDGFAKITKGRSSAKIQILEEKQYPELPTIQSEKIATFHKADLQNAISSTQSCIFQNFTRYNINGLHFNFKQGNGIDVVSTDGHRLAKFEIEDTQLNFDAKITIPRTIIGVILKVLETAESDIQMLITNNTIQIECGSVILFTKLIDAEFPDYNRVIPKHNTNAINVLKMDIFKAIDRASAILKNQTDTYITFDATENTLKIKAVSGVNEKVEEIDCQANTSFRTGINPTYLMECISALPSKECVFYVSQPNMPLLLKDTEETRLLYIIMPTK